MKVTPFCSALIVVLTVVVTGCSEKHASPAEEKAPGSSPVVDQPASDAWLGKWDGPEGTFLQLEGGNGAYEVTIQNLDGPRLFHGRAVASGIEFERDGVKEAIRATNGAATGMKWLADKSNCLTVRTGEGYCRD